MEVLMGKSINGESSIATFDERLTIPNPQLSRQTMAVSHHPQFPGLSISICLKIWCSTHPPALRQKCVRVGQIKRFSSLPAFKSFKGRQSLHRTSRTSKYFNYQREGTESVPRQTSAAWLRRSLGSSIWPHAVHPRPAPPRWRRPAADTAWWTSQWRSPALDLPGWRANSPSHGRNLPRGPRSVARASVLNSS